MSELRIILTTVASEEDAASLVLNLLEEKLIACGTLIRKARSFYWWQGNIEESVEILLLLKTDEKSADPCVTRLTELHPYEVPEIIVLNPEKVSQPYADWVRESLSKTD
jgi:periplasmic divalent cation tolerance protein